MDIPLYRHASLRQVGYYESKRRRKLLLNKAEITKIIIKMQQDKLHLIPLQVYIGKYGKIKIQI
jgi:tmRNA-binding protein